MFALDKEQFGSFVAQLRKEKGLTQKELAQRLFLSDTAISKWETGNSLPDVSLLVPLAEILDVTVSELLECRRITADAPVSPERAEALVKTALTLSEEDQALTRQKRRRHKVLYAVCLAAAGIEYALLLALGYTAAQLQNSVFLVQLLAAIFGLYFCFFAKERLPTYYDENRINGVIDGPFRLNLPGLSINNSNWPHLVAVGRLWCFAAMTAFPPLYLAFQLWLPRLWDSGATLIVLLFTLGGLFVPMYAAGKRYE